MLKKIKEKGGHVEDKVVWISVIIVCLIGGYLFVESKIEKVTKKEFSEHNIITHAMGEIEGNIYTNSKEAFISNYKKGARVFEVDLVETLDGHIVARHDWNNKLYETLNQDYAPEEENKPLTYEQFKSLKIHNKYTPIDFEDILDLMSKYKDIYIVTDTKSGYPEDAKRVFDKMIKMINEKDSSLIERLVPQIYSQAMYPAIKELYDFNNVLYTLYMDLSEDEQVLNFVLENNIAGVVMSEGRYSKDLIKSLNDNNVKSYIHTINDPKVANNYIKSGIFGIYTDYPEIKEKIN